jgi:glycerol kinase
MGATFATYRMTETKHVADKTNASKTGNIEIDAQGAHLLHGRKAMHTLFESKSHAHSIE